MKVAISFHGQPRFYKEMAPQWRKLIDALNADVYIHTWWGEDMIGERYGCAPHAEKYLYDEHMTVTKELPSEMEELYQPTKIEYTSTKVNNIRKQEHIYYQFYTQYRSKELIKESGIDYDVVIRTRFDVHIATPIPLVSVPNILVTSSTTPYNDAPNDFLSISDQPTFEKISDVYLNIEEFRNNVRGWKLESFLTHQIIKEGITNKTFPATYETFDLVRSDRLNRLERKSEKLFL